MSEEKRGESPVAPAKKNVRGTPTLPKRSVIVNEEVGGKVRGERWEVGGENAPESRPAVRGVVHPPLRHHALRRHGHDGGMEERDNKHAEARGEGARGGGAEESHHIFSQGLFNLLLLCVFVTL